MHEAFIANHPLALQGSSIFRPLDNTWKPAGHAISGMLHAEQHESGAIAMLLDSCVPAWPMPCGPRQCVSRMGACGAPSRLVLVRVSSLRSRCEPAMPATNAHCTRAHVSIAHVHSRGIAQCYSCLQECYGIGAVMALFCCAREPAQQVCVKPCHIMMLLARPCSVSSASLMHNVCWGRHKQSPRHEPAKVMS